MNDDILETKFARIGARLKLSQRVRRGRWIDSGAQITLDVRKDEKGEFFEIARRREATAEVGVVDVRADNRHLLLLVEEDGAKHKFLCGHDERHWFVAAIPENVPGVGTVRAAIEALKPVEVQMAEARKRVRGKGRYRRKNPAYIRQGEWFFLPAPDLKVDAKLILRNEPLVRGNGGKPHWAEFCYRAGGETVYVSRQYPNGLLERDYQKLRAQNPESKKWSWRVMRRNAEVYVKGQIRHADHKTVGLHFWHRVLMNTESQSHAMRNVAFLD